MFKGFLVILVAIVTGFAGLTHIERPETFWTLYANWKVESWAKQFSEANIKKTCGGDPRIYYNCFFEKLQQFESEHEWTATPGAFVGSIIYMTAGTKVALSARNQLKALRKSHQDDIDTAFQLLHIMYWTGTRIRNISSTSTELQNYYDQNLEKLARKYDDVVFRTFKLVNAVPNSPQKMQYMQRLEQYGWTGNLGSDRNIASQ